MTAADQVPPDAGSTGRDPGRGAPPARRGTVLSAAALAGAAVMTVELAAVRLLAPHFGSSATVWTNVIGVVLAALALGYALGARWSAGAHALARLRTVLLSAAAWVAALPFAAPVLASWLRPQEVALHEAMGLIAWGSLAATLVLFAPPIAVLGTAGPLAVELLQRGGVAHAGTAGGWVLGVSTAGSLLGTFATTHLLVPEAGLRATFLVASGALVAAGLLLGARPALAGVGVAVAALGSLAADPPPRLPPGVRLVAFDESPYAQVRVVEEVRGADDDTPALRYLQVGEVSDSFQSAWQPETGLLPDGFYYNDFALPLWWAGADVPARPRVLFVGLGAGTGWRVLLGASPAGVRPVGVGLEIDPTVVELARRHLDLEHEDLEVAAGADARALLRSIEGSFDLIVVDAYAHQFEVPAHLCTLEFFRELAEHLAPGGYVVSNAAGFGFEDPVVRALAGTLARGLESDVLALLVPFSRNVTLFARRGGDLPDPRQPSFVPAHEELARLARMRCVPGRWHLFGPDAAPLRDDWNPVNGLQVRSLEQARSVLRAVRP